MVEKINRLKLLMAILAIVLFTSCDKPTYFEYQVENKTGSNITVAYESTDSPAVSDTLTIANNSIETLIVQFKGIMNVDYYEELESEQLIEFSKMNLYIYDTLKSTSDFLQSEHWDYTKKDAHHATQKCIVQAADF